ncbi:Cytochrome P450 monooxygenase virE [Fulvia fulva]|uniref:Cytochrome P450 monooxygenase virE n=1 Tax=Passalora fulva TaxID=5499 RepID=A0A9Q8L855_PASFU|nr:Cytochrome P450 monooxygenase virE [Fulvia fulva]KAK4634796.1 Cytochrome P450 monooxygenase virE [Fulvia fulva]KAK4636650.1 Cytochrome P450 monooxygenase virE [Fulvia fulva]UJO12565.1 Cytochrome P450 monooxygenase virE [Fulvia fulva]WPV09488.1 Cytochrome P450 monooxygenase virE [Fulvia fulva]WPV23429.1 Cytochrome P450 monooxygenase virE [Fulvia fulva]
MLVTLFILLVLVTVALLPRSTRILSPPAGTRLPGPPGLPFIGNVLDITSKCVWTKFHEWAEKYGPIYQVNLGGTNHVWLTRDHVAQELLSKRSAIYSGRPLIPALEQDNRTSDKYVPLMSPNSTWSRQRKFGKQILDQSQKADFFGYPELETVGLLHELMTEPTKYDE